jgi:hypothetical protein
VDVDLNIIDVGSFVRAPPMPIVYAGTRTCIQYKQARCRSLHRVDFPARLDKHDPIKNHARVEEYAPRVGFFVRRVGDIVDVVSDSCGEVEAGAGQEAWGVRGSA